MRRFFGLALAAAIAGAVVAAPVAPAQAQSAYTADQLVAMFAKDKANLVKAKTKLGGTRKLCIKSIGNCDDADPPPPGKYNMSVNFEFNSDQLTGPAKANLVPFAEAIKNPQFEGTKYEVDGYTDASGRDDYNMTLSERRAASVVSYLASLGVDSGALVPKGYGRNKPKVTDPFSPENRRVEINLTD